MILKRCFVFYLIVIFTLSFFQCSKPNELDSNFFEFSLEKESEFKVESLTSIELLDYSDARKAFLGYTYSNQRKYIVVVSLDGDLIAQVDLQGEGPNEFSSSFSSISFSQNGFVWVMTPVEILLYDLDFKLVSRRKYSTDFMTTFYGLAKPFSFYKNGSNNLDLIFSTNPSDISRFPNGTQSNFDNGNLLQFFDLKIMDSFELFPIRNHNISFEFFNIVKGLYAPIYTIDKQNNVLYLSASFDNKISIFDLNSKIVKREIPVFYSSLSRKDSFPLIDVNDFGTDSEGFYLIPKNNNIFLLDNNYFALEFYKFVSINPSPKHTNQLYDFKHDDSQLKLLIFDGLKQISKNVDLPEFSTIKFSLPNNRFLVKISNPDIERDFTVYCVYRLVKKD